MEKKTICIDFDGVIHDYCKGYQGEDKFGAMIAGADTGTSVLKQKGWTIIIFTTRKKSDKLENWLKEHGIAYDYINENPNQPENTSGKIIADMYLDDRGICFRGTWDRWLLDEIMSFEPCRLGRSGKWNRWPTTSMTRRTAFGNGATNAG